MVNHFGVVDMIGSAVLLWACEVFMDPKENRASEFGCVLTTWCFVFCIACEKEWQEVYGLVGISPPPPKVCRIQTSNRNRSVYSSDGSSESITASNDPA